MQYASLIGSGDQDTKFILGNPWTGILARELYGQLSGFYRGLEHRMLDASRNALIYVRDEALYDSKLSVFGTRIAHRWASGGFGPTQHQQ